jgi:hypothetical protein
VAIDEFLERVDFVILDYALDEEDGEGSESDPGGTFDIFPTTDFQSGAEVEEEGEQKPSQQEDDEADSDPVNGIEYDGGEEAEHGAFIYGWSVAWGEDTTVGF